MTALIALDDLERLVLRNVRDDEHARGVTDENKARHDQALMRLIARDFVAYNPRRKIGKFALTVTGKAALEQAEAQDLKARCTGLPFSEPARVTLKQIGDLFRREPNATKEREFAPTKSLKAGDDTYNFYPPVEVKP